MVAPPLVITEDQLEELADILDRALASLEL